MPNPVIQVRVSEETLVEIDKRGNRSDVIRAALESYLHPKTISPQKVERFIESVSLAAHSNYFRPAHALDCKCLMCKPPKP